MEIKPNTVDDQEVTNFNGMSSYWWDPKNKIKPLHSLNGLRVPLITKGLVDVGAVKKEFIDTPTPLKGLNVLEVGCGGGILTEALARLGPNMVGIDMCPDLISEAKQHASLDISLTNLEYLLESVEDHSVSHYEKYDVIVTSEVLEHVLEPETFLECCVKCLKPGGSIFVTTINKTVTSLCCAIILAEYICRFAPRGTHQWKKFITPKDTKKILQNNNCSIKTLRGMIYNFIADKWYWSSIKSINYGLHAIKA